MENDFSRLFMKLRKQFNMNQLKKHLAEGLKKKISGQLTFFSECQKTAP